MRSNYDELGFSCTQQNLGIIQTATSKGLITSGSHQGPQIHANVGGIADTEHAFCAGGEGMIAGRIMRSFGRLFLRSIYSK